MSLFSDLFSKKSRPLPKSERYYEEEDDNRFNKYLRFPVFVAVSIVLVVAIIIAMFALNYSNNTFVMFNKAVSNNFDCGSFKYDIKVGINGTAYMNYDGEMEFDLQSQRIRSSYHAVYEGYEYDAVIFGDGVTAYRGNYYGGKWSVDDYSEKALDIYDFYRDYRKGDFDAGAAVRFTDTTDVINPQQLGEAVENIYKELSRPKNMMNIMGQEIKAEDGSTTVMFKPQLKEVSDIILANIGSAFSSADEYAEFKANVENSTDNLESADLTITYVIDDNDYLSEFEFVYVINGDTYFIVADFSDFEKTQVSIPDGFLQAANL